MTGLSVDADSWLFRFRQVKAQWLGLVLAAALAYALLVGLMVLSANSSAARSRALAGTATATEVPISVEPVALRPVPVAAHPRDTAAPESDSGVVFYAPGGTTSDSKVGAPVPAVTTPTVTTPTVTPVTAAQLAVDQARQVLGALQAGRATAAELAAARYELARALQNLDDLHAGIPGTVHHDLDVWQARVYRDLAIERCRATMTDPAASRAAQDQAYALVKQWQKRLDDLLA